MRLVIYGTLIIVALLLLGDTYVGTPLSKEQQGVVAAAVRHIRQSGLTRDAGLADQIAKGDGYRESRFYGLLVNFGEARGRDFSYYAYTPLLSRRNVFLGAEFWRVGTVGKSSVLVHEMAHVTRHRRGVLRGLPRHKDEAEAYLRQYLTHSDLGLSSQSPDGIVYWDMMIGIHTYVLPLYPEYAQRPDIRQAISQIEAGLLK